MKGLFLLFLILFALPAIGLLWIRHRKIAKRFGKIFLPAIVLFGLYAAIADPVGSAWRAWVYNTNRTLGTWLGGAAYETIILAVILAIIFSFIVIVFAEKEENGKSFWPFV